MAKGNSRQLTDVQFMSADEKRLALKHWSRFLLTFAKHFPDREKVMRSWTMRLYDHITLHCSFIAHYDREGFYSTYFEKAEDAKQFFSQFDKAKGAQSIEYGGSYWRRGEYQDINETMCEMYEVYKEAIEAKLKEEGATRA